MFSSKRTNPQNGKHHVSSEEIPSCEDLKLAMKQVFEDLDLAGVITGKQDRIKVSLLLIRRILTEHYGDKRAKKYMAILHQYRNWRPGVDEVSPSAVSTAFKAAIRAADGRRHGHRMVR